MAMKLGIGFDCPFRDECLIAEERASGKAVAVWIMFCGGFVLGFILGMAVLSAWH